VSKRKKKTPHTAPRREPVPRRSTFGVCSLLIGLSVFLMMAATEHDEMVSPLSEARLHAENPPDEETFVPPPPENQLSHVFLASAFASVVLMCAWLAWVKRERMWWSAAAVAFVLAGVMVQWAVAILAAGAVVTVGVMFVGRRSKVEDREA
jgi:hypothetical protein